MGTTSATEEIRRLAYEIWQCEGEPEGRDREHWERAKRIVESRGTAGKDDETREGREEAVPVNPGFKEVEPGMVPEMKEDPAPDLPDPPMGRFTKQLMDVPDKKD